MPSLWRETTDMPRFAALDGDIKTDILIIGGGMVGLLCALLLQKAGADYALAEAGRVACGVTGNTTAKITSQHGLIYDKLLGRFGTERARMYLNANQEALAEYQRLARGVDCRMQRLDNFVYSRDNAEKLEDELLALDKLGFKAIFERETPLPFPIAGAVGFPGQGQFHPLRFLAGVIGGLNIYEHTRVNELRGLTAITEQGRIKAQKVIMATHFPFIDKHGAYYMKMYQQRSYVLALEGAADVAGMYVDEAEGGLSFRNSGDLLLLGGGGSRVGKKGDNWAELSGLAQRWYPASREVYRWAAQDCMTLDGMPYIGPYSRSTPGFFVATGFNKWGMTSSMVAARLLTDMALGRDNEYAALFDPARRVLRPQLAMNALESTVNLLTPTAPRCTHLGCALKWNDTERSWDCPCHGSRFGEDGAILNGPAMHRIRI